mmetsp:Transcript_63560/g.151600  ORF Transcript_63560/g.151600 Transcript_63560/m.151600 type:complete len:215 (+) Transcript_63560:832-1476(+)
MASNTLGLPRTPPHCATLNLDPAVGKLYGPNGTKQRTKMPLAVAAMEVTMMTGRQSPCETIPLRSCGNAEPKQKAPNMTPIAFPRSCAENQVESSLTPGGYTNDSDTPTNRRQTKAPRKPPTSSMHELDMAAEMEPQQISTGPLTKSGKLTTADTRQPTQKPTFTIDVRKLPSASEISHSCFIDASTAEAENHMLNELKTPAEMSAKLRNCFPR